MFAASTLIDSMSNVREWTTAGTVTAFQAGALGPFWGGIYDPATDPSDMSSCQKTYKNQLKHALNVIGPGELVVGRGDSRISHVYYVSSQVRDGSESVAVHERFVRVPWERSYTSSD